MLYLEILIDFLNFIVNKNLRCSMKKKLFSFLTSKLSWNLNVLKYVMNFAAELKMFYLPNLFDPGLL